MKDERQQHYETYPEQTLGAGDMTNQTRFAPTAENTRSLRHAFGCFGTGVTIITAQTDSGPLGITANSFSSISLVPALVLWSPAKSSKRHDPFVKASHFCIHVLADTQLGLAKHFASAGGDFDQFDWAVGPHGAPTLEGCLAEFHCDTEAVYPAGDHSLVLGHIRTVVHSDTESAGLLFAKGGFGTFTAL